jgi:hypothetical protein
MADLGAPSLSPAVEPRHRELAELYAYWREKRGERLAPSRADIDPLEIPSLLPFVTLVDVERAPLRFRYRVVGTNIVRNVGDDFTGRYLDSLVRLSRRDAMAAEFSRVVESAVPAVSVWDYTRADGRHLRYERLIMPLITAEAAVDMLFGGMVFDIAYG